MTVSRHTGKSPGCDKGWGMIGFRGTQWELSGNSMGTPGLEGGVVGAGKEAGTGLGNAGELTEWTVVVSQCV